MAAVLGLPNDAVPGFLEQSPTFINNKRKFIGFLEAAELGYDLKVRAMLKDARDRLIVDLDDVKRFDAELGNGLQRKPLDFMAPFQSALKSYVLSIAAGTVSNTSHFSVGIEGSFGKNKVSPRGLFAIHLSTLVCVEGIVTRCSLVRPKVHRTVHYCEATNEYREAQYHDATSMTGLPTGSIYPTKDDKGNPFTTEFGLSEYRDHQQITIQEMPERTPAGLLPCSVDVVLDDDLVDRCKPGDRVQIFGVYRALPNKGQNGSSSGVFRTIMVGNHVRQIGKDHLVSGSGGGGRISDAQLKDIKRLAKRPDIFELLARSLAPSIYGHDHIKKALVLLLLGGVEHTLDNGTHIRGDINLLMVGDPSTAKSQFLRFVLNIAPLAINTTGRGSSGVGLTAAVISDKDTGERRLEAGAMVLGDRGVVCIDEFDKMSAADRVAIHEVMEQQTVTIAKAGIHMSLNARCSVVAAANPVYGQYDNRKKPMENVNLPDSLLSRFDLLFIVLDQILPEVDRSISDHVLRNHRYRPPNSGNEAAAGADWDRADDDDLMIEKEEEAQTDVFERYNKALRGYSKGDKRAELLSLAFVKKYLEYAKAMISPVLTDEASALIAQAYADLRNQEGKDSRTLPVTARSLETLIRLSTAHSKLRLSKSVQESDVKVALELMKTALHHDMGGEANDDESSGSDDDDDKRPAAPRARSPRPAPATTDHRAKSPKSPRSPKLAHAAPTRSTREEAADPFALDDAPSSGTAVKSPRTRPKSPRSPRHSQAAPMDVDEAEPAADTASSSSAAAMRLAKRTAPAGDDEQEPQSGSPVKRSRHAASSPVPAVVAVSSERVAQLQKVLVAVMQRKRTQELKVTELAAELVASGGRFDDGEVNAILSRLEEENKVMVREGTIHRI